MPEKGLKRFQDKVVIVTGSNGGIGRGIALRFASEGARVVLNGRNKQKLAEVEREFVGQGYDHLIAPGDVGQAEDVDRMYRFVADKYGTVDVLVNNAGWADPVMHVLEMDKAHWDEVMSSNLRSVFLMTNRAANLMVDQRKRGSVINISSFGAARSHRYMAAYDATKGGIESFTRAAAVDLGAFGIRVNAVGPGAIMVTPADAPGADEERRTRGQNMALGRVGRPEDIAGAVTFLASEDADYITGQVLYVDGGAMAAIRNPQQDAPLPERVAARVWFQPDWQR